MWMADAARRHRGELAAWHAAIIVAHIPFTGQSLSPVEINPYRDAGRRESAALKRVKALIARCGLAALAGGSRADD